MLLKPHFKFSGQFFTKKKKQPQKLDFQSYVTSISQLLTNLYDTSTIPILGKLCHIATYGRLVNPDFVIIRFPLPQIRKFYSKEIILVPTKSYLHIPMSFKSSKNICIPPLQSSSFFYSNSYPFATTFSHRVCPPGQEN